MLRPCFLLTLLLILGCCTNTQGNEQRWKRGAVDFTAKLWKSPIPVLLDSGFDEEEKANLRATFELIKNHTCIDFKENYDDGTGFKLEYVLQADQRESCYTYYIGDKRSDIEDNQKIHISRGMCTNVNGFLHETMHALGLRHTHERYDRDNYVTVADSAKEYDGYIKMEKTDDTTDYGIPYEFNSIMHYRASEYMQPKDINYKMTMTTSGPIFNDWKLINLRYKCIDACHSKTTCQNGGYNHPRACEQCVCPQFYKGASCDEGLEIETLNPGSPMSVFLEFTHDDEILESDAGMDRSPARLIKAPEGTRIRVEILQIKDAMSKRYLETPEDCSWSYEKFLEIVDGDLTRVGKMFCLESSSGHSFLSETNVLGFFIQAQKGFGFSANFTLTVEG